MTLARHLFNIACVLAFVDVSLATAAKLAKIDVHAHFVADFYARALREAGHNPGPDGMPGIPEWTAEAHLEFMEQQNVKKAYLSISSPGVYLNVPSSEATEKSADLARRINIYGSQLKKKYPNKFGFFASLPLPDIPAALKEIEFCLEQLDPKPDGFALMSNAFGMYFGEPDMDQVYKVLNAANTTIFEHPTTPCTQFNALQYHTNATAPPITPAQWQTINRPIANRQLTTPVLDFTFDTARTFADLFVSHVPERYPHLKWIIPHAGGGIFSSIDRLVNYGSLLNLTLTEPAMKDILDKQFFFDLAGPWPVNRAIPTLLGWVKYTKILWGSDTPWTKFPLAATTAEAFDRDIRKVFDNDKQLNAVSHGNAERLFRANRN